MLRKGLIALTVGCCTGASLADAILASDFRSAVAGASVEDESGILTDLVLVSPPTFGGPFNDTATVSLTSPDGVASAQTSASQNSFYDSTDGTFSKFTAQGTATALASVADGADFGQANVNSQAPILIDFHLDEPHFYEVDLSLENTGNLLAKSDAALVDQSTFEMLFSFAAGSGESGEFTASGLLPAGSYQLLIDAELSAFAGPGEEQSGSSSYDFSMTLVVPAPGAVPALAACGAPLALRRRRR